MVVHLWGKFWMAAWRGKPRLDLDHRRVCFLASIGTAFTGYLVQTNLDSQWIATQAKDGINSVGIGAWFNVLNVGQALLYPRRAAAAGRRPRRRLARPARPPARRGAPDRPADRRLGPGAPARSTVPAPRGAAAGARERRELPRAPGAGPKRRYDIVKEFAVAVVVVAVLTVVLAASARRTRRPSR